MIQVTVTARLANSDHRIGPAALEVGIRPLGPRPRRLQSASGLSAGRPVSREAHWYHAVSPSHGVVRWHRSLLPAHPVTVTAARKSSFNAHCPGRPGRPAALSGPSLAHGLPQPGTRVGTWVGTRAGFCSLQVTVAVKEWDWSETSRREERCSRHVKCEASGPCARTARDLQRHLARACRAAHGCPSSMRKMAWT